MKITKKFKLIFVLALIFLLCSGIGVYFIVAMTTKPKNSVTGNSPIIENNQNSDDLIRVFPDLNHYDFYKYIRVYESGDSYISDDMIAKIVTEVLLKMQFTDGNVWWNYNLSNNRQKLDVYFKHTSLLGSIKTRHYEFWLSQ